MNPASGDHNVGEVVAKANWLKRLVADHAIWCRSRGLHWVATGSVSRHPAFSRRRRVLAKHGVSGPKRRLRIP